MNGLDLLRCICDDTRFSILALLQKRGELCVNDFVVVLKKDQPLISHHLRTLKGCGILASRENGKKTMYYVSNKQLSDLISNITSVSKKMPPLCNRKDSKACC